MYTPSTKEIISRILDAEEKSGVYRINYRKNLIWPFYRMYFYYKYLKSKANIGDIGSNQYEISKKTIKKYINFILKSRLIRIFIPAKKDFMIFSSQRYKNENEIYTADLIKILNENYLNISFTNRFEFKEGAIYLDTIKIIFKFFSKILLFVNKRIPTEVESFFNSLVVDNSFRLHYKRFQTEYIFWYKFYSLILWIQNPKKIFVVNGIALVPLTAAAEKKGIEIIEFQHGIINQFHLGYHFPNRSRGTFFPNKLLVFSSFWKSKASFPKGTEIISIGNKYFFSDRNLDNKTNSVLIIGDGILYKELIKFVQINLDFFKKNGFKVIYKLHPGEVERWQTRYGELFQMFKNNEIKVVSEDPSIRELLAECKYVIGVNSTSIYESIDSGCKTIVLDCQGWEYYEDEISNGIIKKHNSTQPLKMSDLEFKSKQMARIFNDVNMKKLKDITFQ